MALGQSFYENTSVGEMSDDQVAAMSLPQLLDRFREDVDDRDRHDKLHEQAVTEAEKHRREWSQRAANVQRLADELSRRLAAGDIGNPGVLGTGRGEPT